MRWIARRKAPWVMSAWLAAMGFASAEGVPNPLPSGTEVLPPVLLRIPDVD
jgi:hypothetical protein